MTVISPSILKQVKTITIRARGVVDSLLAGEYRSVFRGQGMEFAEVRAYEPGDDFRAIDWNVSARLGSPYVKTFTEERELTVLVLVDQSGSYRTGSTVPKATRAVEVAAVLALAAARQNDRVGALLFTEKPELVIPPGKGRQHAMRIIRDLCAFSPHHKGTDLAAALRYAIKLLNHRSLVVILSDFQAEGWVKPFRQLTARHDVIAVTVNDPREAQPTPAGWILFEDAETGTRTLVNTADRQRVKLWQRQAARFRQLRSQELKAAGADHIELDTLEDFGMPLRRIFAMRSRARRTRRSTS